MMATNDEEDYLASTRLFGEDEDSDEDDCGISQHEWRCTCSDGSSNDDNNEAGAVADFSIIYHLALLAPGHGNALWNACVCIAEHLSSPSKRVKLLGKDVMEKLSWPPRRSLEFGAGAALPSMVLIKEGTSHVVITDRKVNDMTFEALERSVKENCSQWNVDLDSIVVDIKPHTWGEEVEKLIENGGFVDVLVASDCIYNPMYHRSLLESAAGIISKERGIFIVGYSYHTNVRNTEVEKFFKFSEEYGFKVIGKFEKTYKEQQGIGSKDPARAVVYCKVLGHRDSVHCR